MHVPQNVRGESPVAAVEFDASSLGVVTHTSQLTPARGHNSHDLVVVCSSNSSAPRCPCRVILLTEVTAKANSPPFAKYHLALSVCD